MIITIDGPAGAGKSTVAKQLAANLGYDYLDTGAIYRTIALLGLRNHIAWDAPEQLVALTRSARIESHEGRTFLDGEDVTDQIRSVEVTEHTKYAADNPAIRQILVPIQQAIAAKVVAAGRGIVTEGRDQGTAVFPDAERKIFLTASPEERARRRLQEWSSQAEPVDFQVILDQINARDARDRARKVGPLTEPKDAYLCETDNKAISQVVEELVEFVKK
ncbi:MAG: (d)CMP kinase [Planctomycetaceae bacterium]|nr:(d)CMP kinase [Planctomycetaceae bacterium]